MRRTQENERPMEANDLRVCFLESRPTIQELSCRAPHINFEIRTSRVFRLHAAYFRIPRCCACSLEILLEADYSHPRMPTKEEKERIELLQGTLDPLVLRTLLPKNSASA